MSYNAVPPPASVGGSGGAVDFKAALAAARAIANKVKGSDAKSGDKRSAEDGLGSDAKRTSIPGMAPPSTAPPVTLPDGTQVEEHFIPNPHVGRVIGKSGEQINRLQAQSGCKIQITQDNGLPQRSCTLTGTQGQRELAKQLIAQVVGDDGAVTTDGITYTREIPIPAGKVGLIIGRGGETIKRLQEQTGAHLHMIQDDPFAEEKPLRVTGSQDQVKQIEQLVDDLISDKNLLAVPSFDSQGGAPSSGEIASNISQYQSRTENVKVPKFAVGSVIGRQGETIKRLQAESGARVQFRQDINYKEEDNFRICEIVGTDKMVKVAHESVLAIIRNCEARQGGGDYGPGGSRYPVRQPGPGEEQVRYKVASNICGLVIGRGGESIREIQERSGAHVELDRNCGNDVPEKDFIITGASDKVKAAKAMILEKLEGNAGRMGGGGGGGFRQPFGGQQQGFGGGAYANPYGGMPGYPGFPNPYAAAYGGYGQQQQYQQPQTSEASDPAKSEGGAPAEPADPDAAPAPGYPTHKEYLANKEWYNKQGYYGVVPQAQPAADYSAQWAAYYAAQGQQQPQDQQQQPPQEGGEQKPPPASEDPAPPPPK
eukprot:m.337327 g.337327  ORF g.337327 m.337327 type:complete len:597 (+) comp18102_c0_seq1:285-2075(+)